MNGIMISLAAEFKGKKAFKDADKNVGGLEKATKKLAKALAGAFAVQKVVAFGKASADAFIKDQAEASKLANVIKNLGMEFANPVIASYVDNLQKISGVADSASPCASVTYSADWQPSQVSGIAWTCHRGKPRFWRVTFDSY